MEEEKVLLPHQQRVVDEKMELDTKLNKLGEFLETEIFKNLQKEDKELLKEQYDIMFNYSSILNRRIKRF